jgi:hypothetical protein
MTKKRAADLKRARNGAGAVLSLPNGKVRFIYDAGKPYHRETVLPYQRRR